ncbi:MAG: hypothetical protein AVDCRST_MAG88-1956, partial [uncultured Thermomicrobiales bacterium]
ADRSVPDPARRVGAECGADHRRHARRRRADRARPGTGGAPGGAAAGGGAARRPALHLDTAAGPGDDRVRRAGAGAPPH